MTVTLTETVGSATDDTVICAVPACTPVMVPELDTDTTAGLLVVHVRPTFAVPATLPFSWNDWPTWMLADGGFTEMVMAGTTVMVALAARVGSPTDVAVTVADPLLTPVTLPAWSTATTVASLVVHVTAVFELPVTAAVSDCT